MTKKETLKLFEERKVRTVWDDEKEKWYFSIVEDRKSACRERV